MVLNICENLRDQREKNFPQNPQNNAELTIPSFVKACPEHREGVDG